MRLIRSKGWSTTEQTISIIVSILEYNEVIDCRPNLRIVKINGNYGANCENNIENQFH